MINQSYSAKIVVGFKVTEEDIKKAYNLCDSFNKSSELDKIFNQYLVECEEGYIFADDKLTKISYGNAVPARIFFNYETEKTFISLFNEIFPFCNKIEDEYQLDTYLILCFE